jgi:hypothetical protein
LNWKSLPDGAIEHTAAKGLAQSARFCFSGVENWRR